MFQSLKKYSFLVLFALTAGCAGTGVDLNPYDDQLPKEGEVYSGSVRVGIYDVPLPKGEWTVSLAKSTLTPKVPLGKFILVQKHGKMLTNSVLIELPLGLDIVEYSTVSESVLLGSRFTSLGEAEINNAFYTKSFYVPAPNTKVKTRGASARSLMYIAPTQMKASYYGKDYIKKSNLNFPTLENFFRVGYQIVGSGNKLFVSYFIDPRTKGVPSIKGRLEDTPWKPSRHYLLSKIERQALEDLKVWGNNMLVRVVDSFNNRL